MEIKTQRHTVHCKEANLTGDPLQVRIAQALGRFVKNGERRQAIGPDNGPQTLRMINNVVTMSNALFGVMLSYESGTNMLVLEDDADAESCSLMQIAPGVSDAGKRREFVDGLLYFGVIGNTVMILQRGAMRASHFEDHVNWLLRFRNGTPEMPMIVLANKVSIATTEKIMEKGVRCVDIRTPAVESYTDDGLPITGLYDDDVDQSASRIEQFRLGGVGMDLIKAVLKNDLLGHLSFKDALDKNIECSLQIRYVGRTDGHHGQRFMNNLATQMRNVEGAEASLVLLDGERVSGEQIRVTANLPFKSYDGVIGPQEAFDTILEWYRREVESGHMRP